MRNFEITKYETAEAVSKDQDIQEEETGLAFRTRFRLKQLVLQTLF
jgi:hypothetical protein